MLKIRKFVVTSVIAGLTVLALCSCGNGKALASISLESPITLQLGETKQVQLAGVLRDGTTVTGDALYEILVRKGMQFESNAPSVASVDENGVLTANNAGSTEINVHSQNNRLTATAIVQVVEPLSGFSIDDINVSTKSGLVKVEYTPIPENADAGNVTVTVGDESIARVDENGNLIPMAPGNTSVTIRSDKGPYKTIKMRVTQEPTELFADDLYVEIGETKDINVYTDVDDLERGEGGANYNFENGDNTICAVTVDGEVTGITVGDSVVKVTNEYGLETEMTVHVTPKTSHITFG